MDQCTCPNFIWLLNEKMMRRYIVLETMFFDDLSNSFSSTGGVGRVGMEWACENMLLIKISST